MYLIWACFSDPFPYKPSFEWHQEQDKVLQLFQNDTVAVLTWSDGPMVLRVVLRVVL